MDPRSLLQHPLDATSSSSSSSSSLSLPQRTVQHYAPPASNGTRKLKRIPRYLEGFVSEQEQTLDDVEAVAADEANTRGGANGKRVKVARACLFCKRSHMSCEDQRPCARCIARGIGDRCCDSEADTAAGVSAGATAGASSSSPGDATLDRQRPSYSMGGQRMSPPRAPSSSDLSEPSPHPYHHHHPQLIDTQPSPGFDAMLAFLGTMDAATAAWGPVPADSTPYAAPPQFNDDHVAWSSLTHMTDDNGSATRIMTPYTPRDSYAPPTYNTNNNIAPPPRHATTRTSPSSSADGGAAALRRASLAPRIDNSTLAESSKPFISGQLADFDDDDDGEERAEETASPASTYRRRQRNRPWAHVLAPDFTASYNLEESIVRPYQYAYGYTRIERWIRSPLSGWSAASADRAQAVLDRIRPLFRNRWAQLSDLQLVQHEERFETLVAHYRTHVCEAVPVPLVVIRRTCEIVCANTAFARLCNTDKRVFASGRLCLYQLMEQACMVAIFERLGDLFQRDAPSPVHLDGQVRFSCASTKVNGKDDGSEQHVAAPSSSPSLPQRNTAAVVQLRHVSASVVVSMEPIVDEYGLPLCIVCTLTPTTSPSAVRV